jgi:hypothetical protein
MKRFIMAWLVAAMCLAPLSGVALASAGEVEDTALEIELEGPALPDADAIVEDDLSLDVDLEPLDAVEPEAAQAPAPVGGLQGNAAEPEDEDVQPNGTVLKKLIRYEISDGEATVISADKAITDANILEEVKGYPVRHIAAGAFAGCKKLWTVTVPESVIDIGEDAFQDCVALVNVELPESLEEIGDYLFKNCTKLSHIDLPEGLTEISEGMFENCQILWRIGIPSTVREIGDGAFYKCLMLKSFTLPSGLKQIGEGAFELCEEMKRVSIPAGVSEIPERCFKGCRSLSKATMHAGLTSIGDSAFYGCISMDSLKLPATVKSLGRFACAYGEDLKTLTIPGNVESLGYGAFFHCVDLKEVCLESGVEELEDFCFAHCGKLEKVEIATSVTDIGVDAFTVGHTSRIDESGNILLTKPTKLPKKLKLYGRPDTEAARYAKENGIPFVVKKIVATSVSIAEGKSATMYVGQTLQLTAVQKPSNAETTVKWSSNSSSVTVSKTGLLKAVKGGKATITVKTENGKKATFTVKSVDAKSVSIDQGRAVTLKVGEKLQLSATVTPEKVKSKLTWSTDKKRVATVSKSGEVTAKKKGTAVITVQTANKKKARIKINVID